MGEEEGADVGFMRRLYRACGSLVHEGSANSVNIGLGDVVLEHHWDGRAFGEGYLAELFVGESFHSGDYTTRCQLVDSLDSRKFYASWQAAVS